MAVRHSNDVLVLGVGRMTILIAQSRDAEVFATALPSHRAAVEDLGAGFIDRFEPVPAYVTRLTAGCGFDLVYDAAGGPALGDAFAVRRRQRTRLEHTRADAAVVSGHDLLWNSHAAAAADPRRALAPRRDLAEATKLADAGKLRPRLDPRRYKLDTIADAHRAVANGTARGGKVVIDINEEIEL